MNGNLHFFFSWFFVDILIMLKYKLDIFLLVKFFILPFSSKAETDSEDKALVFVYFAQCRPEKKNTDRPI